MPATLLSIVQHWKHQYIWAPFPAEATRWCCKTVLHPPPSLPRLSRFLSSKCHSVCYKSCNSSLCLQIVAYCAGMRQPGGSLLPPPPKKKNTSMGWRVPSFLGASWLFPPLHLPRQTSCIHPFIHPCYIHPSDDDSGDQDWNHQSGLLEEAMVVRRAVVLCRRCSGWRR